MITPTSNENIENKKQLVIYILPNISAIISLGIFFLVMIIWLSIKNKKN